jgi:uncharacterized membrane protein YphA (DoxX/SURF4 family)
MKLSTDHPPTIACTAFCDRGEGSSYVTPAVLIEGCSGFWGAPHDGLYARFIAIGVGSLLLAGLWTPSAGALQAIIEVWIIFGRGGTPSMHLLLAALGVSLVMLGPGAWSVDARLFGRKRIDIRSR